MSEPPVVKLIESQIKLLKSQVLFSVAVALFSAVTVLRDCKQDRRIGKIEAHQ